MNDGEDVPARAAGFGGDAVRSARDVSARFAAPARDVFVLKDGGIREAEAAYAGFDGVRAILGARLDDTDAVRGGAVRGELTLAGADRGKSAIRGAERLADALVACFERGSSDSAKTGAASAVAANHATNESQRFPLFLFMGHLRRPDCVATPRL